MATVNRNPPSPPAAPPPLPPLQSGDRMTRAEFERRWDAMPELKKAELIEGVVYVASPVPHRFHGNPHFNLIFWLGSYAAATPGVEGGDISTLRLGPVDAPQADAYLLVLPANGGTVPIDVDGYIVGGPDLVAEVAASSANIDLHAKLNIYCRYGVREYVVWRVYDQAIDWFVRRAGRYERLPLTAANRYESDVLPGLWLDPAALMAGNMLAVAQVVQQGIATPEHAAFVARLQQAGPQRRP
jgi:Uma2 family endonuclease